MSSHGCPFTLAVGLMAARYPLTADMPAEVSVRLRQVTVYAKLSLVTLA